MCEQLAVNQLGVELATSNHKPNVLTIKPPEHIQYVSGLPSLVTDYVHIIYANMELNTVLASDMSTTTTVLWPPGLGPGLPR